MSLGRLGVQPGSSPPDAADALLSVDCCDASSIGVPSGPVVTTDVTPPVRVWLPLTLVITVPEAVVVMPLSCMSAAAAMSAEG